MDVRTEISYPGATVDDVFALALDPDFRSAVCVATMAVEHHVDVQAADDGSTVVTVSRHLPAAVPDFVKKMVGETLEIVQVETWAPYDGAGTRHADLSLTVVGQPARMRGSLVLGPGPDGVVEHVRGDVKVSMPFIGGKFESELVKGIVAAADKEQQLGREWLARTQPGSDDRPDPQA